MSETRWSEYIRRKRGGMSRVEFARKLVPGLLSYRTVQDWEQARHEPPGWVKWLIEARLSKL